MTARGCTTLSGASVGEYTVVDSPGVQGSGCRPGLQSQIVFAADALAVTSATTTARTASLAMAPMESLDPNTIRDMIPFAAMLGIELLETGPDLVVGRLGWTPERTTTGGAMNGGALMALADNCGGVCAFLNLPEGARGTTTIESKTNFLRGVFDGAVTATTRPLHRGRTTIVLETELVRDDGKLAAKVTQTQAFLAS